MTLTREKVEAVDPVYKDFMLALRPVIDTRKQPFPITGIAASKLYDASARKYGYTPEQFYEIAENLKQKGLIDWDRFGFYIPTDLGEDFIKSLIDVEAFPSAVPPLTLGN